jgi:predicted 3-demethylubiquinone-9 3-methyltransferase (glyoxalase superfamily)
MQKITPFLMFNEGAAEAMEFYTSIFKDSRIVSTLPGPDGSMMGGSIEIEGQRIYCYNGGPHFSFSQGISLMVGAETQDEIDHLYDSLSKGGEQLACSWLTDKFGVSWQIVPPILMRLLSDADKEKAGRVMNAMLKMTKIIIADLEAAASEPPP